MLNIFEKRKKERKQAHTFSCKLTRLFVFVCGTATWSLIFVKLKCKKAKNRPGEVMKVLILAQTTLIVDSVLPSQIYVLFSIEMK